MRLLFAVLLGALFALAGSAVDSAAAASDDFDLEHVVGGLSQPLGVEIAPGDDRLFVVEKGGRIKIIDDGSVVGTFLDISSRVSTGGERGLLGLAFHPEYESNLKFYVNYTNSSGDTRVVEYTANPGGNTADTSAARTLLAFDQPASNHNGGHLAFGPDGYLYISSGDGGGTAGRANGQDESTVLGGILRLDVSTGDAPPSNPFVGKSGADELWVYGLRNPWRFTIDSATGNVIIGDVGQNRLEEIDLVHIDEGAVNLGWATMEGTSCFSPSSGCDRSGLRLPIHEYSHSLGSSITGGHVYRGDGLIGYDGHYFYGDFIAGWVRSFRLSNGTAVDHTNWTDRVGTVSALASFGLDADGELLLVSLSGDIWRLKGPESPLGRFERLTVDGGVVSAVGWTFDPDVPGLSIPVHVYVDGQFAGGFEADVPRGDVNQVFGIAGDHGFRFGVDADPGDRVCVFGINNGKVSAGNHSLLGCLDVPQPPPNQSPLGRFERLTVDGGVVSAVGWTFDPDVPGLSIPVHVYVDGQFAGGFEADVPRGDVNQVFGIAGDHGFRFGVDADPGDRVCVFGINDGKVSAGNHSLLGCLDVPQPPPNQSPLGRFERLTVDGGVVSAVGWTFDPDVPGLSIPVHVYVDGQFAGGFEAEVPRGDVNQVFGIAGDHGFRFGVDADPGDRVCVFGINDGKVSAGNHSLLGCLDVGS